MKALITGASAGIGRDIARVLHAKGIELILVARREERLAELRRELGGQGRVIALDLSQAESCTELHRLVADENVDIVINNAGFGVFGPFDESDLDAELRMLDTNIRALHILTKLFVRDFKKRGSGYILNVASSAAFLPGPLMAAYYAGKAYVLRLTQAIREELRRDGSGVYIGALCPGPVNTEFNGTAGVVFSVRGLSSMSVAKYAVDKMFERKAVIVPGTVMKVMRVLARITPDSLLTRITYHVQKRKK